MRQICCETVLLHPKAKAPQQATPNAMGHDICCVAGLDGLQNPEKWPDEQLAAWREMEEYGSVILRPGQSFLFRTGFAQAIEPGFGCMLWDRSGMGAIKQVGRLAGVIDSDYTGEWFVRLVNHSQIHVVINCGDKIVQGVYQEQIAANCPIVSSLGQTTRGTAGFGSTDVKPAA